MIKLAVSTTTESDHTITLTWANSNKTKLITDVDLLKKIHFINHRPRRIKTKRVLHIFSNSKTRTNLVAVAEELLKNQLNPPFYQELHNLETAIHTLRRFSVPISFWLHPSR